MGSKQSQFANADILEDFFEPFLVFGLLWHDVFEAAGCIFLLISRFECFPFERVVSLCFVFRSVRFGSVLASFFLLDFALACSLRLFVLIVFSLVLVEIIFRQFGCFCPFLFCS